jgi:hypothetical protein
VLHPPARIDRQLATRSSRAVDGERISHAQSGAWLM